MLSRAASTARSARMIFQRARRRDSIQYSSSNTVSVSPPTRPAEPPPKRKANNCFPSALPLAPGLDSGAATLAPSTSASTSTSSKAEEEQSDATSATESCSLDEHFMRLALGQARQAASRSEVPVGALLVSRDGATVLAAAGNCVEAAGDATAHAELVCLQRAAAEAAAEASTPPTQTRGGGSSACSASSSPSATSAAASLSSSSSPLLSASAATTLWPRSATAGSTLYVTLEPCAMCAGAALLARVGRIVYGARSAGAGADGSWVSLLPREGGERGGGEEEEEEDDDDDGGGEDIFSSSSCSSSFSSPSSYPTLEPLPARPHPSHPVLEVTRGVLAQECSVLLKEFFRRRRAEGTRGTGGGSGDGDGGER